MENDISRVQKIKEDCHIACCCGLGCETDGRKFGFFSCLSLVFCLPCWLCCDEWTRNRSQKHPMLRVL